MKLNNLHLPEVPYVASLGLLLLLGCQLAPAGAALPSRAPAASPSTLASPSPTSTNVQWAFTQAGGHPDAMLAAGINLAQKEVNAAIYALNRKLDVDALVAAQQRCTCVRLISDTVQSTQPEQRTALLTLRNAEIPVKVDSHTGIMHLKVIEIDRSIVYEGSFNVTNAASTINDEILVRIESADFATAFAVEFDRMWNDPRRFKDWQPSSPTPGTAPSPSL